MTSTATAKPGLARIGQILVPVRDLRRAVEFYRDILGMRFLFEVPRMAFFDCGGIRLLLGLPEGDGPAQPATVIYYKVDDIRESYESLRARGVRFKGEPHFVARLTDHDLWMAFLIDSEENLLALMSEVPL
jgi:methylmalonyl-CoA/ethylmalonyl-CoA epimerase